MLHLFSGKKRPPKSGAVERAPSHVMALPGASGTPDVAGIVARLREAASLRLLSYREDGGGVEVSVESGGAAYVVRLRREEAELPELYTVGHRFTGEALDAMRAAREGVLSEMVFPADPLAGFQAQLRVLACAVPDAVGLIDFSGERILSGPWARMAALAKTPPAPSYLYTIQAVGGEREVWLHTHGLNRCGSIELEILAADEEHYRQEASVIQTVAGNIVSRGPLGEELEDFWIGRLSQEALLIGTWVDWETAVGSFYRRLELGGRADRRESHSAGTGVLMCYPGPDDCERKRPAPIAVFDSLLEENPILMITDEETARMSALARERFDYFRRGMALPDAVGILKFGMPVDEAYREESGSTREHLWFEALEVGEGSVRCRLTQDAYYIDSLREGAERDVPLELLTDWILYLPDDQVTPDSAYLLEEG